jgi:hypothetical protein
MVSFAVAPLEPRFGEERVDLARVDTSATSLERGQSLLELHSDDTTIGI